MLDNSFRFRAFYVFWKESAPRPAGEDGEASPPLPSAAEGAVDFSLKEQILCQKQAVC
jgi:hypothetical protein